MSGQHHDGKAGASAVGLCFRRARRSISGRQAGRSSYKFACCRGSALFELLLAVLIFGVAALALARSLNQVGLLAIESKQAAQIQSRTHSLLFEYGFAAQVEEGEIELPSDDEGVVYRLEIEAVEIENMEGLVLPDMFKIVVKVNWVESGQQQEFSAETLRYAPLYR